MMHVNHFSMRGTAIVVFLPQNLPVHLNLVCAALLHNGKPTVNTRGYWDVGQRQLPISTKEVLALLHALQDLFTGCVRIGRHADCFLEHGRANVWRRLHRSYGPTIKRLSRPLGLECSFLGTHPVPWAIRNERVLTKHRTFCKCVCIPTFRGSPVKVPLTSGPRLFNSSARPMAKEVLLTNPTATRTCII